MRRDLEQLRSRPFDVAIVGGGIHGAWLAMRASMAGLSTALIERGDFAAATSANSLKILHGGLRYLQHLDFGRMRSSIQSRREHSRMASEHVRPLRCLMPLEAIGVRSPWILGPALAVNDLISADRNKGLPGRIHLPTGMLVSGKRCRESIAPLADVSAMAGACWWDAIAEDTARLALEPLMAASEAGAVIANRVEALELLRDQRRVVGIVARDCVGGDTFEVRAGITVDATGPWAGRLSATAGLPTEFLPPRWVAGMNLVLRRSLGIDQAVALSVSSKRADRSAMLPRRTRELFFVPWRNVTMIGTDYPPIEDREQILRGAPTEVVENFLSEIAKVAPKARVTLEDVSAIHWGLLPGDLANPMQPAKSATIAHRSADVGIQGLVIVVGEKMTSAPALSRTVLHCLLSQLPQRVDEAMHEIPRSATRDDASTDYDGNPAIRDRLIGRYGRRARDVMSLGREDPRLFEAIHPSLPTLRAEVVHAIKEEMALGLEDLLSRRLALSDAGHPGLPIIQACASIAAGPLGWSEEQTEQAVRDADAAFGSLTRESKEATIQHKN
jgi:glycerol-3-phosphate dehydrogenase